MRNIRKRAKQQNRGFSLFTVIIAVSLVGILGLLILYIALSNFQMKITDLKGKDSFYTAERALEEIRAGLQEDVGEAMSKAYTQVLENYNKDSSSKDASMDQLRKKEFEKNYISEVVSKLRSTGDKDIYDLAHLQGFVDLYKEINDNEESLIITNPSGKKAELKAIQTTGKNSGDSGVLLKNLKVIYVDSNGRAAVICTDIFLKVPEVQFPTPSTLPDLMNMIVVADKGIICEGTDTTPSTIQGSIYAGLLPGDVTTVSDTSIQVGSNASLSIDSGDKIVCEGEINVNANSTFSSGNGVNLWARGLNADSVKNVSLLGTTYFADDLTISGKNNDVKIAGTYYGYGSVDSALDESCRMQEQYKNAQMNGADLSSAIVINGKNTTLDLSEAQKVMLAGRNYIASSKVSRNRSNKNDIITGESITVKGTQLAYLVPSEIIGDGTKGNPMTYNDYFTLFSIDGSETININTSKPVDAWGGRSLSEIGVDAQNPVQTVFYNDNSTGKGGHVYFYLNFTDDQKAADFMQMYYQNNPNIKTNMDRYLSFYFGGENSGINIKDGQAYLRYITNGNALSYDGNKKEGNLQESTESATGEGLIDEQIGYQNSWYALNRKMISSVDLLNTAVKEDDNGTTHDETDSTRSVYDNLVNEKKMVEFIKGKMNSGDKNASEWRYTFTASEEDGGLQAIMYHNGSKDSTYIETAADGAIITTEIIPGTDTPLTISEDMAQNLRLVVCTGDVVIEEGVEFKGIIMAKGTITLKAGAKLESSPIDAARVFQAQMDSQEEDSVKPQDFFWDGDQYVLGNSTSSNNGNNVNGSSVYSIADCVSYQNWKKQ